MTGKVGRNDRRRVVEMTEKVAEMAQYFFHVIPTSGRDLGH